MKLLSKFLVRGNTAGNNDGSRGVIEESFLGLINECLYCGVLKTGGKVCLLSLAKEPWELK